MQTFVLGGERIYAHKVILWAQCPYFKAMFESDMRESQAGADIEVNNWSAQAFMALYTVVSTFSSLCFLSKFILAFALVRWSAARVRRANPVAVPLLGRLCFHALFH